MIIIEINNERYRFPTRCRELTGRQKEFLEKVGVHSLKGEDCGIKEREAEENGTVEKKASWTDGGEGESGRIRESRNSQFRVRIVAMLAEREGTATGSESDADKEKLRAIAQVDAGDLDLLFERHIVPLMEQFRRDADEGPRSGGKRRSEECRSGERKGGKKRDWKRRVDIIVLCFQGIKNWVASWNQTVGRKYVRWEKWLYKSRSSTFGWRGERWRFPEAGCDTEGERMPLCEISAIEFCEATDLYNVDARRYARLIAAILCRPENEVYNEARAKTRAARTEGFPEHMIDAVLDELELAHEYFASVYPYCYAPKKGEEIQESANGNVSGTEFGVPSGPAPAAWNDLLLVTANYLPNEIKTLERMNCYEFMRIANSKLKNL